MRKGLVLWLWPDLRDPELDRDPDGRTPAAVPGQASPSTMSLRPA
jgi:hypothetical protein